MVASEIKQEKINMGRGERYSVAVCIGLYLCFYVVLVTVVVTVAVGRLGLVSLSNSE